MSDNRLMLAGINGAGADGTGLVWMAPTGSTAPTDSGTALAAAWKNMGGITEAGVSIKQNVSSDKKKIYGSTAIQRVIVKEREYTVGTSFAETNARTQEVFWQQALNSISPTVSTGAYSISVGSQTRQLYALVVDMIDAANRQRFYFPQVEVTEQGELKIGNGETLEYQVTMSAYPNTSGVAMQIFGAIPVLG